MTPDAALATALRAAFPDGAPSRIGVAVSGGGDSMALLWLLARWASAQGVGVFAVSVDHGLRSDAAAECRLAAGLARQWDVPHETLHWAGWNGQGNLQAAARAARHGLIADWARRSGLRHVALAHTRDDQAETVLLRLARGSGVDGLSAMAPVRADPPRDLIWLRPLLDVPRAALRDLLTREGIVWAEDPSNTDPRFDRVKARALLSDPPLPGLKPERLAETAARMRAARSVLTNLARKEAERLAGTCFGAVYLKAEGFFDLADDTRWRVLSGALCLVAGQSFRPRLEALQRAEAALKAGQTHSLHGCLLHPARDRVWVLRETGALSAGAVPCVWDRRWRIDGPADGRLRVGPLGETGLAQAGDWRAAGMPHLLALGLPGIWQGDRLCAAPALPSAENRVSDWTATPVWEPATLAAMMLPD